MTFCDPIQIIGTAFPTLATHLFTQDLFIITSTNLNLEKPIMRTVLIIVVLLIAAFLAGWLKFRSDSTATTIEIDKAEIRQDTDRIIQEGKDLVNRGKEDLHDSNANADKPVITP